jgi:hypothetical protein
MAELVVLGAGLSGTLMAYELVPKLRKGQDRITVIGQGSRYHFVPSNPWVAIGWREKQDIEVDLEDVMRRKGIRYFPQGARRVFPNENRIELEDGNSVAYDYLVVATDKHSRFVMSTTLSRQNRHSNNLQIRPARSWSARSRAPHASARPTSSPSSWIPSCESAACATAFR